MSDESIQRGVMPIPDRAQIGVTTFDEGIEVGSDGWSPSSPDHGPVGNAFSSIEWVLDVP